MYIGTVFLFSSESLFEHYHFLEEWHTHFPKLLRLKAWQHCIEEFVIGTQSLHQIYVILVLGYHPSTFCFICLFHSLWGPSKCVSTIIWYFFRALGLRVGRWIRFKQHPTYLCANWVCINSNTEIASNPCVFSIVAQYMMVYNNPQSFVGTSKSVAIVDLLKNDGLEKRLTLGLRVIRAVYKVDGIVGFYRYVIKTTEFKILKFLCRGFFSSVLLYIPSSMVFWR